MGNGIKLFSAEQVKLGEQKAAELQRISMYTLMERAGKTVFDTLLSWYPVSQQLLVVCGSGNNGGDGYVVARLAKQHGFNVILWHVGDPANNQGDALLAQQAWLAIGGRIEPPETSLPKSVTVIVDALFGTGLSGPVRSTYLPLIELINRSTISVVSIDIPSGLNANTGAIANLAIQAKHTVTFIGQKQGLHTGAARNVVGQLTFAGLNIEKTFEQTTTTQVELLDHNEIMSSRPQRHPCAHKGTHGKALLFGGNKGMAGAISLTSQACARCGAGLTRAFIHPDSAFVVVMATPEVMTEEWSGDLNVVTMQLKWASALVIGPGLGLSALIEQYYRILSESPLPKIVDADGLNLLAKLSNRDNNRVITPHPGEAANLLGCTIEEVESDRFQAVKELYQKYAGIIVLKGAGSLIHDGTTTWICTAGNPGMASGGMGDVLSGVIGALLAQGLTPLQAAKLGVWLHSTAADQCVEQTGMVGLLASDIIPYIRQLLNA